MMAVYVEIKKLEETKTGFIYTYTSKDGSIGHIEVDIKNRIIAPASIASGDDQGRSCVLAARKLFLHMQKGEFPESTCWAS